MNFRIRARQPNEFAFSQLGLQEIACRNISDLAQRALQEDELFVQQLLPVCAAGHQVEEDLTAEVPERGVLGVELERFHRLLQRCFVVDLVWEAVDRDVKLQTARSRLYRQLR